MIVVVMIVIVIAVVIVVIVTIVIVIVVVKMSHGVDRRLDYYGPGVAIQHEALSAPSVTVDRLFPTTHCCPPTHQPF